MYLLYIMKQIRKSVRQQKRKQRKTRRNRSRGGAWTVKGYEQRLKDEQNWQEQKQADFLKNLMNTNIEQIKNIENFILNSEFIQNNWRRYIIEGLLFAYQFNEGKFNEGKLTIKKDDKDLDKKLLDYIKDFNEKILFGKLRIKPSYIDSPNQKEYRFEEYIKEKMDVGIQISELLTRYPKLNIEEIIEKVGKIRLEKEEKNIREGLEKVERSMGIFGNENKSIEERRRIIEETNEKNQKEILEKNKQKNLEESKIWELIIELYNGDIGKLFEENDKYMSYDDFRRMRSKLIDLYLTNQHLNYGVCMGTGYDMLIPDPCKLLDDNNFFKKMNYIIKTLKYYGRNYVEDLVFLIRYIDETCFLKAVKYYEYYLSNINVPDLNKNFNDYYINELKKLGIITDKIPDPDTPEHHNYLVKLLEYEIKLRNELIKKVYKEIKRRPIITPSIQNAVEGATRRLSQLSSQMFTKK